MDGHLRKLDTKIHSKETELNAPYTKIQKLEEEITPQEINLQKTGNSRSEMSVTGVALKRSLKRKRRRRKSKDNHKQLIYSPVEMTGQPKTPGQQNETALLGVSTRHLKSKVLKRHLRPSIFLNLSYIPFLLVCVIENYVTLYYMIYMIEKSTLMKI